MQLIDYIIAWMPYWLICTLHYPIVSIKDIHLKAVDKYSASQVYYVDCVSKMISILSIHFMQEYMGPCAFNLHI